MVKVNINTMNKIEVGHPHKNKSSECFTNCFCLLPVIFPVMRLCAELLSLIHIFTAMSDCESEYKEMIDKVYVPVG